MRVAEVGKGQETRRGREMEGGDVEGEEGPFYCSTGGGGWDLEEEPGLEGWWWEGRLGDWGTWRVVGVCVCACERECV